MSFCSSLYVCCVYSFRVTEVPPTLLTLFIRMSLPRRRPAGGRRRVCVCVWLRSRGEGWAIQPAESQTIADPSAQILNLGRHLPRSHTLRTFRSACSPRLSHLKGVSSEAPPPKEKAPGNFPQDVGSRPLFFPFSPELFPLPLSQGKTCAGRKEGEKKTFSF